MSSELLVLIAVAPTYFALGMASIVWVHWTELRPRRSRRPLTLDKLAERAPHAVMRRGSHG